MQGAQGVRPYKTVRRDAETEIVINKSRFIGRCYAVCDEAAAAEIVGGLRKRYWDATHHCYAYRLGAGGTLSRSSDDGEPSGTAGAPILGVLTHMELCNALIVVTRYFGGVLLGAGGLIRAYAGTAAEAAKNAGVVTMRPCTCLSVTLSYPQYAAMESRLCACGEVEDIAYTDVVTAKLWTPDERVERVTRELTDASDGRAAIERIGFAVRPAACNN